MEEGNDQGNEDRLGSTEVVMNWLATRIEHASSDDQLRKFLNLVINAIDSADEVVRLHKLLEMAYEVYSRPLALCKDADDRVGLLLSLYLEHSQPALASLQESLENLQIRIQG